VEIRLCPSGREKEFNRLPYEGEALDYSVVADAYAKLESISGRNEMT